MVLLQSTVQYYALEGNYCHMRSSLLTLLKRFGSDPLLLFWRGFSMILEGTLPIHTLYTVERPPLWVPLDCMVKVS